MPSSFFFTAEKAGAGLTNSSEKATGIEIIHLEALEIFLSKVLPCLSYQVHEQPTSHFSYYEGQPVRKKYLWNPK